MAPNTDGLSILSTSKALSSGINLGTSYNGAINLSGIVGSPIRGTGMWDIGAYQYQSEGSHEPNMPQNFKIVQ